MKKMSEKALEKLRERAEAFLKDALPSNEELGKNTETISGICSNLAGEIAARIVMNAKIVGRGSDLRDQVLIVLADYRDHAWAKDRLVHEGKRIYLADRILNPPKKRSA